MKSVDIMQVMKVSILAAVLFFAGVLLSGCGKGDYLDPTQVGRFRPVPVVNVILDTLGVAEEKVDAYEGAEEPRPIDLIELETDYVLQSGDTVRISIFELVVERTMFIEDKFISETGKISIPEVGQVQAAGLTEAQLEDEIKQILSPSILKEPSVTVVLRESQSRIFTILGGGVPRPSRYGLPRREFRLAEAMAMAGSPGQFNVSYIYVTRAVTGTEELLSSDAARAVPEVFREELPGRQDGTGVTAPAPTRQPKREIVTKPAEPNVPVEKQRNLQEEMLEIIAPRAEADKSLYLPFITSSEMVTGRELEDAAMPEGIESMEQISEFELSDILEESLGEQASVVKEKDEVEIQVETIEDKEPQAVINEQVVIEQPAQTETSEPEHNQTEISESEAEQSQVGRVEWIYRDGRWIPVSSGAPAERKAPAEGQRELPRKQLKQEIPEDFGLEEIGSAGVERRVIKIPVEKLMGGDYRYNIVIRPGDMISVPLDTVGFYYVMGNFNRQGEIGLTGRDLTLKMAIASAGGLNALAWPQKVEVIRRIGKRKEETVLVDYKKITEGSQPDFVIKDKDIINVGTHPSARWLAVVRNAFRATYGFGFLYDRNFADLDLYKARNFENTVFFN